MSSRKTIDKMFLSQMIRPAALLLMISSVTSLKIASKLDVLEWTPELVAKEDYFNGTVSIVDGGIANLTTDASVDLGSNSETQLLRQFGAHKNIRTILTTAEVYYRIVASKRAGIRELKDLRGKRIGAIPSTSSEYFVQTYLASVGLTPSDYTIVSGTACLRRPCGSDTFPAMLRRGAIHAIGMWEPSVQLVPPESSFLIHHFRTSTKGYKLPWHQFLPLQATEPPRNFYFLFLP